MSDRSKIEWTDASWNPLRARLKSSCMGAREGASIGWHCEHVSEGCRNCYAEAINRRLGTGLDYKPGVRQQLDCFLDEKTLLQPLHWRKPRKIFVCSMTDLFGDWVTDEQLDRIFAVMALCPQHTFIVVTKRPERMREYFWQQRTPLAVDALMNDIAPAHWCKRELDDYNGWPLDNVWLLVSICDQPDADKFIPILLTTPAAVRGVSYEPALGPVDFTFVEAGSAEGRALGIKLDVLKPPRGLDWVICGGESGPNARPMHPDWARSARDQCAAAGVPFFFKQWGEFLPVGQHLPGCGKIHGATAVKPGRMKLHYAGTPKQEPKHAFAERGVAIASTADGRLTFRVGKKRAGRLLDGIEHNGFPQIAKQSEAA